MRLMILVVCLLIVAVAASLTINNKDAVAHTIQPGVIAASNGQSVFFMHPNGGISAVQVASGDILWHTDAADKPIYASSGKLVAQADATTAGQLSLALLTSADGKVIATPTLDLPAEVRARVSNGMGSRFELLPIGQEKNVELMWRYEAKTVQGARLDPSQLPARKKQAGGLSVNLSSGNLAALPDNKVPTKLVRPDIEHPALKGIEGRQFISADGNYVLASEMDEGDSTLRYAWRIYDLDGQLIGATRSFVSYAPFMVRDSVLMFVAPSSQQATPEGRIIEEPLTLRAIDLSDGQEVWRHQIRDTAYRGPMPS